MNKQAMLLAAAVGALSLAASVIQAAEPSYEEPSPARRLALVIGNASYAKLVPLPGDIADAGAIATELRKLKFEVTEVHDVGTGVDLETFYVVPFARKIKEG